MKIIFTCSSSSWQSRWLEARITPDRHPHSLILFNRNLPEPPLTDKNRFPTSSSRNLNITRSGTHGRSMALARLVICTRHNHLRHWRLLIFRLFAAINIKIQNVVGLPIQPGATPGARTTCLPGSASLPLIAGPALLPAAAVATRVSTEDITHVTYFERVLVFVDIRIPLSSFRAGSPATPWRLLPSRWSFHRRMFKNLHIFSIKIQGIFYDLICRILNIPSTNYHNIKLVQRLLVQHSI